MIGRRGFLAGTAAALAMAGAAAAEAALPRILAFGDSLTAGFALPRADGLTAQLQDWLRARDQSARIINGGLSGDTTYGGRVRIHWSLRRHNPDAVIVELGGNDMLMGLSPAKAEANLDAILTAATAGGRPVLLVGIYPPRGDPGRRRRWASIWPRLARRHGTLLLPDIYAPLLTPSEGDPLLLADGIHPSPAGVKLLVERLGPHVIDLLAELDQTAAATIRPPRRPG